MISIETPTRELVPLVLDSPHSGDQYPRDFKFVMDKLVLRRAEDAFVDGLFRQALNLGASFMRARFPRAYIDTNRSLNDLDVSMLEGGSWPEALEPSKKLAMGAGLLWKQVKVFGPIYDRKLSVSEVQARIESCWKPYHRALAEMIDSAHQRHGKVVHINCHSMASRGDSSTEDGAVLRPDFVLGDRDGTTCDPLLTHTVATVLRGQGYSVAINDPYKGVELVRRYSDPANGRHSLQIEISRRLYMDELSITKTPGFEDLRQNLTLLLAQLVLVAEQLPDTRRG